jgi:hypothetical protein
LRESCVHSWWQAPRHTRRFRERLGFAHSDAGIDCRITNERGLLQMP